MYSFLSAAFLEELRNYAMALHTREQAPREGKAPSQKPQRAVRFIFSSSKHHRQTAFYILFTIFYSQHSQINN
jgi:hypothetical protein